jgi:hypothetical protein
VKVLIGEGWLEGSQLRSETGKRQDVSVLGTGVISVDDRALGQPV